MTTQKNSHKKQAKKPATPQTLSIASQITLKEFHPAPYNPRKISEKAKKGLKRSLEKYGDLSGITLNKRTGNYVAGHQRINAIKAEHGDDLTITDITERQVVLDGVEQTEWVGQIKTSGAAFTVRIVDWPLTIERQANVVANLQTISGQYTESVNEIADEMESDSPDDYEMFGMDDMEVDLSDDTDDTDEEPEDELEKLEAADREEMETSDSPYILKDAPIFKSSTRWGIPDLLPDHIFEIPDTPKEAPITWCSGIVDSEELFYHWVFGNVTHKGFPWQRGIVSFYTHDRNFERIWDKTAEWTQTFLERKVMAIVSPNWTLTSKDPATMRLLRTYKSRYMARYWQNVGIKVIPNIAFDPVSEPSDLEFVLNGLPVGLPTLSIELQSRFSQPEHVELYHKNLDEVFGYLKPQKVLVYSKKGMNEFAERYPNQKFVFMESLNDQIKIVQAAKKAAR
jgi:hypothetical protein